MLACLCLALTAIAASPVAADELVVDNTDGSVQVKGAWAASSTTQGFVGTNYLYRTPGDGSATVTWPFPAGSQSGSYEVFARWTSGPNRADNATYQVNTASGSSNVSVNQQTNGGSWQSLGVFSFQAGQGQGVTMSDKADGVVVADGVRFIGPRSQDPAFVALPVAATAAPASTPAPVPTAAPAAASAAPSPAATATSTSDPRYFAQTRFRIDNDAFWDYFQHRGAVRTFGYPVSNTFTLLGTKVQVFQRLVMQLKPDGSVGTLNLLDSDLLPFTHFNGSTVPAPDSSIAAGAPKPDDPDYLSKVADYVRQVAPDTFDGQPVNFAQTFFNTVSAQDVFPNGMSADQANLLPGFDLELWGLPTSAPAYDPNNHDFIYMRFQRGIMHYDKGCGCTQGLLLADYLKEVLENRNLPPDVAAEAKNNRFFGQWAPGKAQALSRPSDLPGTDLTNAFPRAPMVTLDPGHGATEIGTSHTYPDGTVLQEKTLTLQVALRLRDLLQQNGVDVTMTRTTDSRANTDKKDLTGDGKVDLADDLQARVDDANNARSDILVSIHFNGTADTSSKGTYMFYDPSRPFSNQSLALAQDMDTSLTASLKSAGYVTTNHGATADTTILAGDHYYLLGPQGNPIARASQMPGVICEPLFLTNDADANAVRSPQVMEAIAQGYLKGILAYFTQYPPS